ncbi:GAD domain-containing protein [Propioniciclava flava]
MRGRSGPSSRGARGLAYITVGEDGTLGGPFAKNISDAERDGIAAAMGANPGDAIFFAAGPRETYQELLGAARLEIRTPLQSVRPERLGSAVGGGRAHVQADRRSRCLR